MAKAKTPGGRRSAGKQTAPTAASTVTVDQPAAAKPRVSPVQFFGQVRAEGRKITWPSRKETWITSVMVFIMVAIAATFFWVVDLGLGFLFQRIISFGV